MEKYGNKEFKIYNESVYGLVDTLRASKYPMMKTDVPELAGDLIPNIHDDNEKLTLTDLNGTVAVTLNRRTIEGLAHAEAGSGHDNMLKGILVQFDIDYPVYWSPQLQRYHFLDIVSST